jgi:predicted oxidoreductase (fatty acid repression mutant protein)
MVIIIIINDKYILLKQEENDMSKDFLTAVADRRTFYSISKNIEVSDSRIKEIIDHAVKYTPSAFNSQSARVVLLLGNHHDQLWNMVKEALSKLVPADKFGSTEEKINSFKRKRGRCLQAGVIYTRFCSRNRDHDIRTSSV